ncbi:MAG: protein kinase [Acidobacteriota bacterium]
MTVEHSNDRIFLQALELSPSQRDTYLQATCDHSSLRREIYSLIKAYEEAGNFLEQPVHDYSAKTTDSLIGRTLGDFLIQEWLGEGGFGVVYRAEQLTLQRAAVVKVLHAKHRANPEIIERFLREARLAARLEHPYSAHVYDFGAESDGLLWIAMEMVHGTTFDQLLRAHGPLPLERFVALLEKICEVVHTAHESGIVHRDLKPANIMVIARAGRLLPKLLDFGIAKGLDPEPTIQEEWEEAAQIRDDLQVVKTLGLLGSLAYMPVEQWERAAEVDHRADIYALGVLSYEAITGSRPFSGGTPCLLQALYLAHKNQAPPSLASTFPIALNSVIAKALAKEPAERYQSAIEFATAFREAAGFAEPQIVLPKLDDLLSETILARAPQPLADAVADFIAARNPHQAREQIIRIWQTAARYLGILALTCRTRVGNGGVKDSQAAIEALRKLAKGSLNELEWLELTRELSRPFAKQPDAYPIPELVTLFFNRIDATPRQQNGIIELIRQLREQVAESIVSVESQIIQILTDTLPHLTTLLRELSFLSDYRLVTRRADRLQCWLGVRRWCNDSLPKVESLVEGKPILIDIDGRAVLSLWPFVQVAEPTPATKEELFFFERRGRYGARLSTMPVGFAREDEAAWEWLGKEFFPDDEDHTSVTLAEHTPYPGLVAFTAADAELFFGRERATEVFLNRLRVQPLLTLVGASGAGKSSFVQAGVIPDLPQQWYAITVRPGPLPLAALAARLVKEGIGPTDLHEKLLQNSESLGEYLRSAAQQTGRVLVLLIDQFEELFTLCSNSNEQQLYALALANAARMVDDPVRVILILRDDFLVRTQELPGLRDRLAQGLEIIATPEADDLMRILIKPARCAGYEFDDPELPCRIVAAVAGQPGALPLLAFTAANLWELRDRHFKLLLAKAYDAMGGVGGALAQHAEMLMAGFTLAEQQLVREVFRQLVTSVGTRATLALPDLLRILDDDRWAAQVVEKLIKARLLIVHEGDQGVERIEIVHEALLVAWPRLVEWQREDREGARLRDQLRAAARQWEERGRVKGLLWRDEALAEYQRWHRHYPGKLTKSEESFAIASLTEAARGRRRNFAIITTIFTILIVGLIVLYSQRQQSQEYARQLLAEKERAERNAIEAKEEKLRAEEQRLRAEGNEAEAHHQSQLAKENAAQAERQLIELYQERGRQEALMGNSLLASVYLNEAYQRGGDGAALRFLLAESLRALDAQQVSFVGHSREVIGAQFSPDGMRIVTTSRDKTVRIWEVVSGKLLVTLNGYKGGEIAACFSPDGTRIITTNSNQVVEIWDSTNGRWLNSLAGHKSTIYDIQLSSDGTRVATANGDGTANVWDVASGKLLFALEGHRNSIHAIAFSRNGKLIATASNDSTAKIWDAANGILLVSLAGHKSTVSTVHFSNDNTRIVTVGDDNTARVWDISNGSMLNILKGHRGLIKDVEFSSDDKRVVTAGSDNTARIWDTTNGQLLAVLEGHSESINTVRFSPDGTRVATASDDHTVKIWEVGSGLLLASLEGHHGRICSASFSLDGKKIVTASDDGSAKVWKATGDRLILCFDNLQSNDNYFDFTLQGARIIAQNSSNIVEIWDAGSKKLLFSLPGHYYGISAATFSSDGRLIATANDYNTTRIWDAISGKLRATLEGHTVAFSPDGKRIVTASDDNTAKIWDTASSRLLTTINHQDWVYSGKFSPDGRYVVTASKDRTAKIWRVTDGQLVATLTGHNARVASAEFSPDGKRVVTASDDNTAKIWDAANGRLLISLEGHKGKVRHAEFSPDGALVVSASVDKTAKVWDSASGKMLASLEGHREYVYGVRFSPDGTQVATMSRDKTIKVWRMALETRKLAEVDKLVQQQAPFRFIDGRLMPVNQ